MLTTWAVKKKLVVVELKGKLIFICKEKKKKKISNRLFIKCKPGFIDVLEK